VTCKTKLEYRTVKQNCRTDQENRLMKRTYKAETLKKDMYIKKRPIQKDIHSDMAFLFHFHCEAI